MGKEEGDLCSMTINILSRTMQQYMCFLDKMLGRGTRQRRREKLLKALEEASRHYQNSSQKERQAFFHEFLTGYAVALKLW